MRSEREAGETRVTGAARVRGVSPGEAYLMDAEALLCYLVDGPGASRVEHLLRLGEQGQARIMISAVDLYDLYRRVIRLGGREGFAEASYVVRQLPLEVLPFCPEEAEEAGEFACNHSDAGRGGGSVVARWYCSRYGWTLVTTDSGSGEVLIVRGGRSQ